MSDTGALGAGVRMTGSDMEYNDFELGFGLKLLACDRYLLNRNNKKESFDLICDV